MHTWSNHDFIAGQYRLNSCVKRCLGKRMGCYRAGEEDHSKNNHKLDRDERDARKEHHADEQQARARRV